MSSSSSSSTKVTSIYDAYIDLPHPAASVKSNEQKTIIIAPPPGEAFEASKEVGIELCNSQGIARVARFCFPEFSDGLHAKEKESKPTPSETDLNKYDVYLQHFSSRTPSMPHYYPYALTSGPSYHSFAMQLANGDRVYGHVRRYLPHLKDANGRLDVGRRAVRASVILTRVSGGARFYQSLLKTIESMMSNKHSLFPDQLYRVQEPYLHYIHSEHSRLASLYAEQMPSSNNTSQNTNVRKPPVISAKNFELNNAIFQDVDTSKHVIPHELLYQHDRTLTSPSSPIMPLLRCLGVSHTLRLFSALLCERRIILTSHSPSRLSACCNAAASILACGLLSWQHIFIPILPPGMITYLAAPMPYLIGLLSHHGSSIQSVQGLGEALHVDLDRNSLIIHGINNPESAIPDLLRGAMENDNTYIRTINEELSTDLIDLLKMDRKQMMSNDGVGTSAANKGKAVMKAIGKWRKSRGSSEIENTPDEEDYEVVEAYTDESYDYREGLFSGLSEELARVAFTSFFVSFFGDMRLYLTPPSSAGQTPTLDKELFFRSRQNVGDIPGTPMYPLVHSFKETQMFEQFVKARIKEVHERVPVISDSPLFLIACAHYRTNRLSFNNTQEVKRTIRQIAYNGPSRFLIDWISDVKKRATDLTSNSRNEYMASQAISKLVKDCNESTFVLPEVMSVIWERIRDSRGGQFKHGIYALQIIYELLLHGPLAAIAEVGDGISQINNLRSYENMRTLAAADMRKYAWSIYELLVNRSKLFAQRRMCAVRRMSILIPSQSRPQINKFKRGLKFKELHSLLGSSKARVENVDLLNFQSTSPSKESSVKANAVQSNAYSDDLLSFDFPTEATEGTLPSPNTANDLLSAFGTMSMNTANNAAQPAPPTQVQTQYNNTPMHLQEQYAGVSNIQQMNPMLQQQSYHVQQFSTQGQHHPQQYPYSQNQ